MFGKVGSFYEKTDYCLEGATLKVKVSINKDYYVTSVKYGGIEMMYNEKTDTYDIVPTEDGKVVVYYGSKEKGTEEKSGCSGNIDAGILAGAVSLLAVVAYVVSFKDKCKRLTK